MGKKFVTTQGRFVYEFVCVCVCVCVFLCVYCFTLVFSYLFFLVLPSCLSSLSPPPSFCRSYGKHYGGLLAVGMATAHTHHRHDHQPDREGQV